MRLKCKGKINFFKIMNNQELPEYIAKPRQRGLAVLMYFGIGILISLLTGTWRDPFVKFHLKQGTILYIISAGLSVIFGASILEWVLTKGGLKISLGYSLTWEFYTPFLYFSFTHWG